MPITPAQLRALVEAELEGIRDARVVAHIRSQLVEPVAVERAWNYGEEGETYPCWSILEHPNSSTAIAYCEFGFGPRTPWGLVGLAGFTDMSMGMDCGWYLTLTDAFFESAAATELPIWRVYKQTSGPYPGVALTDEADWESTWAKVYALRVADPTARYHCSQSIQIREDGD
ncbi:hypothetical protein [Chitinimonas sp.]|uniref:hypothetical protein n=1 Tax=Chitinimonas sp. TaxID=1934313 RepID=UPI002F92E69D